MFSRSARPHLSCLKQSTSPAEPQVRALLPACLHTTRTAQARRIKSRVTWGCSFGARTKTAKALVTH